MSIRPVTSVLFVCVRNGGKSVMAAALAAASLPGLQVRSAGTEPGERVNALSAEAIREVGLDISRHRPSAVTGDLLRAVDLVVLLGAEVGLTTDVETQVVRWETDEPSARGIEGLERMRLVRDDIAAHIERELRPRAASTSQPG